MASVEYPNQFFLGRSFDHTTGETSENDYVYDPDDLTTHAVVVGMTGSGKTGLCLDLMEEAALNNLPAILIDPKGDITNLLLHFPELLPADFEPWINPDNARRAGKTVGETAAETASLWKNGLAGWGIESDRIQNLKDSVHRAIYTPGSTAGKPISILASLKAPTMDWATNQEVLLEQIEGTVTALLSLIGLEDVDPVSDPQHILLSKIIADAWAAGKDVDLGELIMQTQNPPFEKLGFFSVDQFFPQKERFALAMKLNSIMAAPSFQPWITGEPLDIQSLFYAPDGKPRHSIFYIAHLSETERMFIVTLLYSAIETWMRAQVGTTSLRALVYFDEIFGYLPPTANPPSKKPMLRMLKQARAFGVGLVLATQNPVDIDYKALSNAGTWFVGRLQTERDKERLLDGLQGSGGSGFDRRTADSMLSGLGKRVFLINNVHSRGGPELFQTRWAMNYLAGPMTRNQIAGLNALAGDTPPVTNTPAANIASVSTASSVPSAGSQAPQTPSVEKTPLDDYTETRPAIPDSLDEYFLPRKFSLSKALEKANRRGEASEADLFGLVYLPGLLVQADVLFTDRKGSFEENQRFAAFIPDPEERGSIRFDDYEIEAIDPDDLDPDAEYDSRFGGLDAFFQNARKVKPLSKKYVDSVYRQASLNLFTNDKLKMMSLPHETEVDFKVRCEDEADKFEDAEIEKIQARFETKIDRLKEKLRKEERELDEDEAQLKALKMETMVNYGETIFNIASTFLGGRKRRSGISSALSKRRQQSNAQADVDESIAEIADLRRQLEEMALDEEEQLLKIDQKWADIVADLDTKKISPMKKNIAIELFGIAWQPHWLVKVDGRVRTIPAA
ncbi:MAG: DUF87 domain-containing protein [Chloroflexota bacterium]